MRKQNVSLTNEGCMMNALRKEYVPCSSNLHANKMIQERKSSLDDECLKHIRFLTSMMIFFQTSKLAFLIN